MKIYHEGGEKSGCIFINTNVRNGLTRLEIWLGSVPEGCAECYDFHVKSPNLATI